MVPKLNHSTPGYILNLNKNEIQVVYDTPEQTKIQDKEKVADKLIHLSGA